MILADSSAVIASLVPRDPVRPAVLAWLRDNREPLGLPSPCLAEISHFLGVRATPAIESVFLRELARGSYVLLEPRAPDLLRAAVLVEQYADFPLGAVDALVVALAERLAASTIFTLDRRHFGAVRPVHRESFTLVP